MISHEILNFYVSYVQSKAVFCRSTISSRETLENNTVIIHDRHLLLTVSCAPSDLRLTFPSDINKCLFSLHADPTHFIETLILSVWKDFPRENLFLPAQEIMHLMFLFLEEAAAE